MWDTEASRLGGTHSEEDRQEVVKAGTEAVAAGLDSRVKRN